jgi:hypothetical protein
VVFFLLAQKKIQPPKTFKNMFSNEALSFNDVPQAVAHLINKVEPIFSKNCNNLRKNRTFAPCKIV